MNLKPQTEEPGLWINRDWQEDTPGLFAVIIGVSRYPYLSPDETNTDSDDFPLSTETYGLGQLKVSALTALEVFRWLRDKYQIDNCPLAKCWCLLSPTEEENAFDPEINENLTEPSFRNCTKALRFWRGYMRQLPENVAEQSRSFFFFSGHGLEIHQNKQILLPMDYLAPPEPSWNDAISTENLQNGLGTRCPPVLLYRRLSK
jgi:hypothetical protein